MNPAQQAIAIRYEEERYKTQIYERFINLRSKRKVPLKDH